MGGMLLGTVFAFVLMLFTAPFARLLLSSKRNALLVTYAVFSLGTLIVAARYSVRACVRRRMALRARHNNVGGARKHVEAPRTAK